MAKDFARFRNEAGWFLKKVGIPVIARVVKISSRKDRFFLYPVEEKVYLVDEEKRLVYTNDEAVKDMVCYYSPFSEEPLCFPKKTTIATDPDTYKGEPLERNALEEAIIATEEALDDDTTLGHFAYYCVTRGGIPAVVDKEKDGTTMVCLGGNIDGYAVSIGMVDEATDVILRSFKNPERALTILYLGGKEAESYARSKKVIVPQSTAQKSGVVFSVE